MKTTIRIFVAFLLFSIFSCSSSKKTATTAVSGDGSSYQNAIIVKSVSEEYAYVRNVCPECKLKSQSLKSQGKKYYDVLYFDKAGTEVIYYFDINSFFGKAI